MSQPDQKDTNVNDVNDDNSTNADNSETLDEKTEDDLIATLTKDGSLEALPPNIRALLSAEGPKIKAVLLKQDGTSNEIDYDTTPSKMEAKNILGALPTIVGEYHEIQVIVVRGNFSEEELEKKDNTILTNKHSLRWPFDENELKGDLLLYRVDDEDEKLRQEWEKQCEEDPSLNQPVSLAQMLADSIRDGAGDNNNTFEPEFGAIDENEEEDGDIDDLDGDNDNNDNDVDLGELDEMNAEDMIGIDKLKEILEKQIRKDFAQMHGIEPSGEMLSKLIEDNIEAMMQFEDDEDDDDDSNIEYKPSQDELDEMEDVDDDGEDDDDEDGDDDQEDDVEDDNNGISGIESGGEKRKDVNKDSKDSKEVENDFYKESRFQQIVLEKIQEEYSKTHGTEPNGDELQQLLQESLQAMNDYFVDESSNDDNLYDPELDEMNDDDYHDDDDEDDDDVDNMDEKDNEQEDNDVVNDNNNDNNNNANNKEGVEMVVDDSKDGIVEQEEEEDNNEMDQDMKDVDTKDVKTDKLVVDKQVDKENKVSGELNSASKDKTDNNLVNECDKENVIDNGEKVDVSLNTA